MPSLWEHTEPHVFYPHWPGQKNTLPAPEPHLLRDLLWFSTSGSTGTPRWIGLSRAGLLASAAAVNAHLALTSTDRWLRVLPLFHVGGFSIHARAQQGQVPVIESDERWSPTAFTQLCVQEKITLTSLVPTQLYDLVTAQQKAPGSLRAIIIGGAALDPHVAQAARALGWPILCSYGMTEAASQIATQPLSSTAPPSDDLHVLPHWQTRVEADDRLALHGPALYQGQLQLTIDGWYLSEAPDWHLTTDRVQLIRHATHTQLRFLSRHDEWVKILGEKINLASVRAAVDHWAHTHHWTGDHALYLDPDPRRGHHLHLHTTSALSADDLTALNTTLAGPARITRHSLVDHIPRSPLGKPLAR
jgi:o-succinylbenzoate---CoA ligase